MMDQRTQQLVCDAEANVVRLRMALIPLVLLLLLLLWDFRLRMQTILCGSLIELRRGIAQMSDGDFSSTITGTAGKENSVPGWLSEIPGNRAGLPSSTGMPRR